MGNDGSVIIPNREKEALDLMLPMRETVSLNMEEEVYMFVRHRRAPLLMAGTS